MVPPEWGYAGCRLRDGMEGLGRLGEKKAALPFR